MTDRRKLTPAEAWKAVARDAQDQKDAARREIDRIAALDDDALDAELRAAGIDPDEASKVGQEILDKAAREVGLDPRSQRAGASRGGPALRLPPRRRPMARGAWLLAAALAAAVVVLFVLRRDAVEAWWHGEQAIGPDDAPRPPLNPTAKERAATLRDQAAAECDHAAFPQCEASLDAAKALDPSGESEPRVVAMRERLVPHPVVLPPDGKDKK